MRFSSVSQHEECFVAHTLRHSHSFLSAVHFTERSDVKQQNPQETNKTNQKSLASDGYLYFNVTSHSRSCNSDIESQKVPKITNLKAPPFPHPRRGASIAKPSLPMTRIRSHMTVYYGTWGVIIGNTRDMRQSSESASFRTE